MGLVHLDNIFLFSLIQEEILLEDLSDKVVVITGASKGIGAGLAQIYSEKNIALGLCARSNPVEVNGKSVSKTFDVVDQQAMQDFAQSVIEAFGKIDLWINNAGILAPIGPVRDLDTGEFSRALEVNVIGTFNGTKVFVKHLRQRQGEGVLINISSGAANSGYDSWSSYSASKAGINRITESVALEEFSSGLRAYAVAPGVVDTDMQSTLRSCSSEQFPMVSKFLDIKANNKFNTIDFIAEQLLAIAFDSSSRPESVIIRLPEQKSKD